MNELQPIGYDKKLPDHMHEPIHQIPVEPPWEASEKQCRWFYILAQILLDDGRLTEANVLYIRALIELIDEMPEDPDTHQANRYLRISASLCYELGLDQQDIQDAGVPIWF